jgi:hypothetical protein
MFPHTHVYFTKELINKTDALLIYGSVLPDIAITGILDGETIADKAEEFKKWLDKKDTNFSSLGLGMITHNKLDNPTHKNPDGSPGYAVEKAKPIIQDVATCCNLDLEKAKVLAHNFIEAAVEILMLQNHPSLTRLLQDSIKKIDINTCVKYFSEFYRTDIINTKKAFEEYNSFLIGPSYYSVNTTKEILAGLIKKIFRREVDKDKVGKILEESILLVSPTYKEFIDNTINKNGLEGI